jgi:prolyl 4-hydroxylase
MKAWLGLAWQHNSKPLKMLGYLAAIPFFYIFVYLPISNSIYGISNRPAGHVVRDFNSSLIATDEPLTCPSHAYSTHILSHEPLIIYIEQFLSLEESKHLVEIRYLMTHASVDQQNT